MDAIEFCRLRTYILVHDPVIKHEVSIYEKIKEGLVIAHIKKLQNLEDMAAQEVVNAYNNSDTAENQLQKEDERFLKVINLRLENNKKYKKLKKRLNAPRLDFIPTCVTGSILDQPDIDATSLQRPYLMRISGTRRQRDPDDENLTPLLSQNNSMPSVSSSRFLSLSSSTSSIVSDSTIPYNEINED